MRSCGWRRRRQCGPHRARGTGARDNEPTQPAVEPFGKGVGWGEMAAAHPARRDRRSSELMILDQAAERSLPWEGHGWKGTPRHNAAGAAGDRRLCASAQFHNCDQSEHPKTTVVDRLDCHEEPYSSNRARSTHTFEPAPKKERSGVAFPAQSTIMFRQSILILGGLARPGALTSEALRANAQLREYASKAKRAKQAAAAAAAAQVAAEVRTTTKPRTQQLCILSVAVFETYPPAVAGRGKSER